MIGNATAVESVAPSMSRARFVTCVIRHNRPIAYAVTHTGAHELTAANEPIDESPGSAFATALIQGTHAEVYESRPVEWSAEKPERTPETTAAQWAHLYGRWSESVQRWVCWSLDGRQVAWTRLGADIVHLGPALRFGALDGPEVDCTRLVTVRREDADRSGASKWASSASRVFASILAETKREAEEMAS